jgi:hypothetical protein
MFLVMPPGMTTESTAAKIPCWSRDDDGGGGLLVGCMMQAQRVANKARMKLKIGAPCFCDDPEEVGFGHLF